MDIYRLTTEIPLSDDHDARADQIVAVRAPRQALIDALAAAGIDVPVRVEIVPAQGAEVKRVGRPRKVRGEVMTAAAIVGVSAVPVETVPVVLNEPVETALNEQEAAEAIAEVMKPRRRAAA